MSYSLPAIKLDIKKQELALRRFAPQRLIFHWEGSNKTGGSYSKGFQVKKWLRHFLTWYKVLRFKKWQRHFLNWFNWIIAESSG